MIPLSVWDPVKRCRVLNPKAFDPVVNQEPEPLETTMGMYKTVLAPDAPWLDKPVKAKPKKRVIPPPKNPSKIKRTDENFARWAAKNSVEIKY